MASSPSYEVKPMTMGESTSSGFLHRLRVMCTRFPVKDTRWITALSFLLGAAFFAVNGWLYVFTTVQPQLLIKPVAFPVTSCIGTFLFFVGCSTAILEELNVRRGILEGSGTVGGAVTERVEKGNKTDGLETGALEATEIQEKTLSSLEEGTLTPTSSPLKTVLIGESTFKWAPSMRDLKAFYIRDQLFLAAVVNWIGIIFFIVSTIAYVPGVADLTNLNEFYYLAAMPFFLGGLFFSIAAAMQMLHTQRKWFIPAPHSLSWYVGFWDTIGSIGFLLGGCLWWAGPNSVWAATLAPFWGSWAWIIGSWIRWYIVMGDY